MAEEKIVKEIVIDTNESIESLGKVRREIAAVLAQLGDKNLSGEQIDGLITASDVVNGRPAPDMILLAMQNMGITDPSLVIKVGDSVIDIEEGKNAKCGLSIGITTGAQDSALLELAKPNYIVSSLHELISLIK